MEICKIIPIQKASKVALVSILSLCFIAPGVLANQADEIAPTAASSTEPSTVTENQQFQSITINKNETPSFTNSGVIFGPVKTIEEQLDMIERSNFSELKLRRAKMSVNAWWV